MESPYMLERDGQIAEFSLVIPEQSKFVKTLNTATLSFTPNSDPHLITYLNGLFRTNQPEQQKITFWFRTPKSPGKTEDFTLKQT